MARSCACNRRMPQVRGTSADAVGLEPAQPLAGSATWAVFAADPARIAQLVDKLEKIGDVEFLARIGLIASGDARDLDMADDREMFAQRLGNRTAAHLLVIEV